MINKDILKAFTTLVIAIFSFISFRSEGANSEGLYLNYNLPETKVVVLATEAKRGNEKSYTLDVSTSVKSSPVSMIYEIESSIWSSLSNSISKTEDGLLTAGSADVDGKAGEVLSNTFKFLGSVAGVLMSISSSDIKIEDYKEEYASTFPTIDAALKRGESTADKLTMRLFDVQLNGPTQSLADASALSNAIGVVKANEIIQQQIELVALTLKPLQQHRSDWIQSKIANATRVSTSNYIFEFSITDLPIANQSSVNSVWQGNLTPAMKRFKDITGHILVRLFEINVNSGITTNNPVKPPQVKDAFVFRAPRPALLAVIKDGKAVSFETFSIIDDYCQYDTIKVPSSAWSKKSVSFAAQQGLLLTAGSRRDSSALAVSGAIAGIPGAATEGLNTALKLSEVNRKLALESLKREEEKLNQKKTAFEAKTAYLDTVAVSPINSEAKVIKAEEALLDAKKEKVASEVELKYAGELNTMKQERLLSTESEQIAVLETKVAIAEATKADKVELEILKLQNEIATIKANLEKISSKQGNQ